MCYAVTGTDVLDWIMINLDGANSVEQAQVMQLTSTWLGTYTDNSYLPH